MRLRVAAATVVVVACAVTAVVALAAKPVASRPRDSDRDGLSNRYERTVSHTRVHRRDTDRDRLGDGLEVKRYHTDPRRKDTDRDRLSDGLEVKRYRTNPRRKDTDRDGLSDALEVLRYGTDPRKRDTDDDELTDGDELKRYDTIPTVPDTDSDGTSDGEEIDTGSDPTQPPPSPPAPPEPPAKRTVRPCSQTVASLGAVQSAVEAAATGAVVCLANGSYGKLELDAAKAGEVVIQPATSGAATIAGAQLSGDNLTLEGFTITDAIDVMPSSSHMTVQFNHVSGGYFGVDAGPTDDVSVNDVTIRSNTFVGPFGEDAIRLNRYHDGNDADAYGALVEGNEFTKVRENGQHSDCLQTGWVGDHLVFRRNYLHDNHCQGFFVKDQETAIDSILAEDNLFVRNDEPCADEAPDCGWSADFQVFGPVGAFRASHNTIWNGVFALRSEGTMATWGSTTVTDSVIYKVYSDVAAPFANYAASGNLLCATSGGERGEYPLTGISTSCSPPFMDAAHDDYRLASGEGVSWRPADQQYGP
jgi:hypothetical protein